MKVRNLYIGTINIITEIEQTPLNEYQLKIRTTSITERETLLYRPFRFCRCAKDVVMGGIYPIGLPECRDIGDEFISYLDSSKVIGKLHKIGYTKKNISKKMLVKVFNLDYKKTNN